MTVFVETVLEPGLRAVLSDWRSTPKVPQDEWERYRLLAFVRGTLRWEGQGTTPARAGTAHPSTAPRA